MAQLASYQCVDVQDLGSSPRSSIFPFIFPQLTFTCSAEGRDHATPSEPSLPRVQGHQINGPDPRSMMNHGQRTSMLAKKSKKGYINWAKISQQYLHLGTEPPPGLLLYIFIIFIFQLQFYFLYCFQLIIPLFYKI